MTLTPEVWDEVPEEDFEDLKEYRQNQFGDAVLAIQEAERLVAAREEEGRSTEFAHRLLKQAHVDLEKRRLSCTEILEAAKRRQACN